MTFDEWISQEKAADKNFAKATQKEINELIATIKAGEDAEEKLNMTAVEFAYRDGAMAVWKYFNRGKL